MPRAPLAPRSAHYALFALLVLAALLIVATLEPARAAPVVFAFGHAGGAIGAQEGGLDGVGWARGGAEGWAELARRQVEVGGGGGGGEVVGHKEFILKLVFSILFVLIGGVLSGLSLGLMGLDQTNLQVLATSGPPSDRRDAQKVLDLLSHGRHFVLCTLLLSNVVVNETLPVFLDTLTGGGGLAAVLISSALIVIFGEVLPQALCARYGLRVGARCVGFVRVLMYLESPINYPVAKLLDLLLGSHSSTLYRREELKTLISLHSSSSSAAPHSADGYAPVHGEEGAGGGGLGEMEVELVNGVLSLAEKTAVDAVVSLRSGGRREAYCVSDGMRVCDVDLREVLLSARPYIPVTRAPSWEKEKETGGTPFIGYLKVEQIVHALSRPNELIRSLPLSPLVQVLPSTSVVECIAYLKKENPSAILLVSEDDNASSSALKPLGFLSLDGLCSFALSSPASPSSPSSSSPHAPILTRETARASLARTRARSSSIGLGKFVQGIVDRQLAHAQTTKKKWGHRASSSQLSFRLSSSEEDNDEAADRPILPHSHSHHRSTSSLHSLQSLNNFRPSPSSTFPIALPPEPRPAVPPPNGTFRFPSTSPVSEETDAFSLGDGGESDDEEDGESSFASSSSFSARGRAMGRRADDSGFGDGEEGKVELDGAGFGEGGGGAGRDPLGVGRGSRG